MFKSKKSFTLLEILIALGVITLIAGAVLVSGPKMMAFHRYRSDVGALSELFTHAQEVAVAYGCDVTLELKNTPKGLEVHLSSSDQAIPFLKKRQKKFLGIQRIKANQSTYTIFSSGMITPSAKIACMHDRLSDLKSLKVEASKIRIESQDLGEVK